MNYTTSPVFGVRKHCNRRVIQRLRSKLPSGKQDAGMLNVKNVNSTAKKAWNPTIEQLSFRPVMIAEATRSPAER